MALLDRIKSRLGIGRSESPQQPAQDNSLIPMSAGSYLSGNTVPKHFDNALAHAQQHGRPVLAEVNGIKDILVDPQSTQEGLMQTYNAAQTAMREQGPDAARAVVMDSPERDRLRSAQSADLQQTNSTHQRQMDSLMEALPQRVQAGRDSTIAWIGEFSAISDNSALNYDKGRVTDTFQKAGYSDEMAKSTTKGLEGRGDQIIGTFMDNMKHVGAAHPSLAQHCERYSADAAKAQVAGIASQIRTGIQAPAQEQSPNQQKQQGSARGM